MKFLLVLALSAFVLGQDDKPIVNTYYGKVQGGAGTSRDGRMYYEFKGIPFAKVKERFQVAERLSKWEDVKDATKFGPKCPQYDYFQKEFVGEEDCLNLNVYTPKLPKEGDHKVLLPVVVILHHGGHYFGSGQHYNPKYFMDEDVIFVTINYRLGPFGYLNTGDMYAQGNMGLKDQSMALQWVQMNIEAFGGDKDRVTLMGFSSGASDTLLHLINPLSKGLFHRASAHSGAPLSSISLVKDPVAQGKKLGEQVGCPTDSSSALVTCLKAMEPLDLLKKMKRPDHIDDQVRIEDYVRFGPSVENILEGQTANDVAIPESPYDLVKDETKIVNKVPLILGITNKDGLVPITASILNNTEKLQQYNDKWEEMAPRLLQFPKDDPDNKDIAKKVKDFYLPEGKPLDPETLISIVTDRYFASVTRIAIQKFSKHMPVYAYFVIHNPEHRFLEDVKGYKNLPSGTGHLDDIQYFFKPKEILKIPEITKDSKESEYKVSTGVVKLWTSFFENGKPTKTWGDGKDWEKITDPENLKFYKIGENTASLDEPEKIKGRLEMWKELYKGPLNKDFVLPHPEKF